MTLNLLFGVLGFRILLLILLSFFVFTVIPVFLCVLHATKNNHDKILYGILGLLFSYIAVLLLYLLVDEPHKNQVQTTPCPYCGEKVSKFAKKCNHCGNGLSQVSKVTNH